MFIQPQLNSKHNNWFKTTERKSLINIEQMLKNKNQDQVRMYKPLNNP
jgi:hypothetical protein